MNQVETRWVWTPTEKKCLFLLQQKNTRATLFQIYAFMLRNALDTNINLVTKLIATFSAAIPLAGLHYARQVFDLSPQKSDVFLCNTMIKSHLGARQSSEVIPFYKHLLKNVGFRPDNYSLSSLAKCCGVNMAFWDGLGIHNHALKSGLFSNLFVATSLVDMYGKFGEMGLARTVFDEMTDKSSVSWTALIDGFVKKGDIDAAKELFVMMPEKDTAAINVMIDAYVKLGQMELARSLFEAMQEKSVVSYTSMIDGYCSNGDLVEARRLFDIMPERNLYSWNAMIGGYSHNKQAHEAVKLYQELHTRTSLEPDNVTVVSVLPAIADLGALKLGDWVHDFVRMKKLDRFSNVCTGLIDMYAKCADIEKAKSVFNSIQLKEKSMWNALINGLAVNGCAEEALEVFFKMIDSGLKPDEITLLGLLIACNHGGLVDEGNKWFKAMTELGLTPRIEHYGCMIDLFGRAGCLSEAEALIDHMPFDANGIILSSFLSACNYAKDTWRAERLIKKAIDMEPLNDGNYILARNLYASERRWIDVEEIKGLMRQKGATKEAGCSVIETNGRVWQFKAWDTLHPLWDVVHFVLEPLQIHMKVQDAYFIEGSLIA